jgi:VWFA-related protein
VARGEPEHGTGIFGSIARSFTRSAAPAVVALVASAAVAGLVTAQEAPPTRTDTVGETIIDRVDVELVNVEVTVTDGDGKPISDLTLDDFEVIDGGRAATISHFAPLGERSEPDSAPGAPAAAAGSDEKPPRILGVFVDQTTLPIAGRHRALAALRPQLEAFAERGDRITLVSWDGSLRIRRDLGSAVPIADALAEIDRDAPTGNMAAAERLEILRRIESASMPLPRGFAGNRMDTSEAEASAVGSSVRFFLESRQRETVATFEAMERFLLSLAGLEGLKTVFFLGGGMADRPGEDLIEAIERKYDRFPNLQYVRRADATGTDVAKRRGQLGAVANAAGVVVHGFVVDTANNLAEERSGTLRMSDLDTQARLDGLSGLERFARATGGTVAGEPTPAGQWAKRVADERQGAYSLGWAAPEPLPGVKDKTAPGKPRRLEIRVRRAGAVVRHRDSVVPTTRDGRTRAAVTAALMLGEVVGDTPIQVMTGAPQPASMKNAPPGASASGLEVDLEVHFPLGAVVLLPGERFHEGKVRIWVATQDTEGRRSPLTRAELPIRVPNQELLTAQGRTAAWRTKLRLRAVPHVIAIGLDDPLGATLSTTRASFDPAQTPATAPAAAPAAAPTSRPTSR